MNSRFTRRRFLGMATLALGAALALTTPTAHADDFRSDWA